MNERKYELMAEYLKGEITVHDMIERIVEFEEKVEELSEIAWEKRKF